MRIRTVVSAAAFACVAAVAYASWLRYEAARAIEADWIVAEVNESGES